MSIETLRDKFCWFCGSILQFFIFILFRGICLPFRREKQYLSSRRRRYVLLNRYTMIIVWMRACGFRRIYSLLASNSFRFVSSLTGNALNLFGREEEEEKNVRYFLCCWVVVVVRKDGKNGRFCCCMKLCVCRTTHNAHIYYCLSINHYVFVLSIWNDSTTKQKHNKNNNFNVNLRINGNQRKHNRGRTQAHAHKCVHEPRGAVIDTQWSVYVPFL